MLDVNSRYIYIRELSNSYLKEVMDPEGTTVPYVNQKARLMSDLKQQLPDSVGDRTGGETVTCENVTTKLSTGLPILKRNLTAICVQCENGKSILSLGSSQASIAHGGKTIRQRSACTRLGVPVTRGAARSGLKMRLPRRLGDRGGAGPAKDRALSSLPGAGAER